MVLFQELERVNVLIDIMLENLNDLINALKGIIGMSSILDVVANALFNGIIPQPWMRWTPMTLKGLVSWFADLLRRLQQ